MKTLLCLLTTLFLVAPVAEAAPNTFPFRDDARKDPSFSSFRREMVQITEDRDAQALLGFVDDDIEFSYGGEGGVRKFSNFFDLNRGGSESFWKEIRLVLLLGGKFMRNGEFHAPYVYANWPSGRDAFSHSAVIGTGVRIRSAPSLDAPVIGSASYEILRLRNVDAPSAWKAVRTQDGRPGYIAAGYLRSATDYRAHFKKIDGAWKMTVFIAGD